MRPISLLTFTASLAGTAVRSSAPRPASSRMTGATNSWNVKMADVGNPGSTTTARPLLAARQIGLPGFNATPWATMPGSSSSATTRYDTSPAPLLVPPDSSTTSANESAWRRRACSGPAASGAMPRRRGSPPISRTASASTCAFES